MKRAFVRFIHGAKSEDRSAAGGETVVYSDGESSTGETESLYQLQTALGCYLHRKGPNQYKLPVSFVLINPFKLTSTQWLHEQVLPLGRLT